MKPLTIVQRRVKSRWFAVNGSSNSGAFGPTFRFRDRPDLVPVMNNLHTKWYIDAVDALVGAFAKKKLKQATAFSQLNHASCVRTATEISAKAQCLHKEIVRQEEYIKFKHFLYLLWRRYRHFRMKRKVVHRTVMDDKIRAGHDFNNVYKNSFLTGALRQFSEQRSADVQSPLQALSTLVTSAHRGSGQVGKRDSYPTTVSKLNVLQGLLSNELPVRTNSIGSNNRLNIRKLSSPQSKRTFSSASFPLSSLIPTSIREKTFKPKVSPIKMERLHSLGEEVSPLASLLGRPNVWTMNGRFAEVLSPRFAPLFKKSSKIQNRFLSPSFFSFYRDSAADNIASIPEMMDKVGMPSNDQEALLEMILELSGASKTINKIFDVVNPRSERPSENLDLDQQVADATARMESVWADVHRSFSFRQHLDFERDGYTFLRRDQLEKLYGDNGLYSNSTKLPLDLDDYAKWTDKDRDEFLKRAVRKLASNKMKTKYQRVKRKSSRSNCKKFLHRGKREYPFLQKQSTSSGRSVQIKWKMRHLYFDPTAHVENFESATTEAKKQSVIAEGNSSSTTRIEDTDAELNTEQEQENKSGEETKHADENREESEEESESEGEEEGKKGKKKGEEDEDDEEDEGDATILEPFAFVVSNLQPSVLGPVILSPNIFSPGVLSPSVLGPTILSPSVGNPLILSPYVLSPVILSPSVLAPGVLSPYVLSPNIINFVVLSPNILSPYVLSPDILSPSLFSPNILSPFILSPPIFSDDVFKNDTFDGSPDILSPSILSK